MMAFNYRVAKLPARQRAMLDFAHKLTTALHEVDEADREALRAHGFSNDDIFDIGETTAFFNLSNRMAATTDMMPNREYHTAQRAAPAPATAEPEAPEAKAATKARKKKAKKER
jgi:uncharacterized protein YciW